MTTTYHRSFATGLEGKYTEVFERLTPQSEILEVGCHTGYFSRFLANSGHQVLGLEVNLDAAKAASNQGVDIISGDVEDPALVASLNKKFDVLLLMDVIEHLKNPVHVLRNLQQLIKPNGKIIATGPNVAYWAVRKNLFLGKWDYTDSGIMDRTHLHFYTASTWKSLLEEAHYEVTCLKPAEGMIPLEHILLKLPGMKRRVSSLRRFLISSVPELFTIVYLIEAAPKHYEP
jgi:methionine biosynthesis protein MetW